MENDGKMLAKNIRKEVQLIDTTITTLNRQKCTFLNADSLEKVDNLEDVSLTEKELQEVLAELDNATVSEEAIEEGMEDVDAEVATPRKMFRPYTREKVSDVSNVRKAPFRWICSLKSYFRDPDDPGKIVSFDQGTGVLISLNHVLTSAHVVYAEIPGSKGSIRKQRALRTEVFPGRDGSNTFPFGKVNSHSIKYPRIFESDLDARWDYALIKLKTKIGLKKFKSLNNQVLGYWGSSKYGQNTQIKALSTSYLKTQILNVSGYPNGKRNKQYIAFDKVKNAPPTIKGKPVGQLITYMVDTSDGQSGSPVWKYIKSTGKRYLVAVHRGGCHSNIDGCNDKWGKPTSNMGVLMTATVIKQLRTWIKTM